MSKNAKSKKKPLTDRALDHLIDNVRFNEWAIIVTKADPEVAAFLTDRLKRRRQMQELLRKVQAPMINKKPIEIRKYEI